MHDCLCDAGALVRREEVSYGGPVAAIGTSGWFPPYLESCSVIGFFHIASVSGASSADAATVTGTFGPISRLSDMFGPS